MSISPFASTVTTLVGDLVVLQLHLLENPAVPVGHRWLGLRKRSDYIASILVETHIVCAFILGGNIQSLVILGITSAVQVTIRTVGKLNILSAYD